METLPPWLAKVKVSSADEAALSKIMGNWALLHRHFDMLSEDKCLKVIVLELRGKKRPEIIGRVKNLYNRLRHQRELSELWAVHPGAGVRA